MDIIDYIEIPSFERRKDRLKRSITLLTGTLAIAAILERYNGSVSRTLKSFKRGLAAAITSWIEDQSGTQLFTLEGDEPPPLTHSTLELESLAAVHRNGGRGLRPGLSSRARDDAARPRVAADAAATAAHQASVVVTTLPDGSSVEGGGSAGGVATSRAPSSAHLGGGGAVGGQGGASEGFMSDAGAAGAGGAMGGAAGSGDSEGTTPQFFQSTKFFASLDVDEARELFGSTQRVHLAPHEVLFVAGQPSDSGIYIVVRGSLGVFLDDAAGGPPIHANTLRYGESVGDLDVVDGAPRSVSCIALGDGALLVQVSRPLFLAFVAAHPRALLLYLQQGLARLWRVAHFMLSDFLALTLHKPGGAGGAGGGPGGLDGFDMTGADLGSAPMAHMGTQTSLGSRANSAGSSGGEMAAGAAAAATHAASGSNGGLRRAPSAASSEHLLGLMSESLAIFEEALAHGSMPGGASAGALGGGSGNSSLHGAGRAAAALKAAQSGGAAGGAALSEADAAVAAAGAALQHHQQAGAVGKVAGSGVSASTPGAGAAAGLVAGHLGHHSPLHHHHHHGHHAHSSRNSLERSRHGAATPIQERDREGEDEDEEDAGSKEQGKGHAAGSSSGARVHGGHILPRSPARPARQAAAAKAALASSTTTISSQPPPSVLRLPPEPLSDEPQGPFCVLASAAVPPPVLPGGNSIHDASRASGLPGGGAPAAAPSPFLNAPPSPGLMPQQGLGQSRGGGGWAGSGLGVGTSPGGGGLVDVGLRPACLAEGWDVVAPHERMVTLGPDVWAKLVDPKLGYGSPFPLVRGGVLQEVDWACGQFYLLVEGHLLAERRVPGEGPVTASAQAASAAVAAAVAGNGGGSAASAAAAAAGTTLGEGGVLSESAVIVPGSLVSTAAFLSSTAARFRVVAMEHARLVAFGWQQLEGLATGGTEPAPAYTLVRSRPASYSSLAAAAAAGSTGAAGSGNSTHGAASAASALAAAAHAAAYSRSTTAALLLPLLLTAARAMGPLIRRFISLGLNRVWLKSGELAYAQGEDATCLYVVISGRLRLLHAAQHPVSGRPSLRVEEEVGRGEAVGAVWAITGGQHDTTALCVRDSELVRMSKAAFKIISEDSPMALSKLFSNIAKRLVAAWDARMRGAKVGGGGSGNSLPPTLGAPTSVPRPPPPPSGGGPLLRGHVPDSSTSSVPMSASQHADIVTIAVIPAGVMPAAAHPAHSNPAAAGRPSAASAPQPPGVASLVAVKRCAAALKEALASHGSVLCVNSTSMGLLFPTAFERLDVLFYRSKITSWLSAQEEEVRFIILEGDFHPTPWSSVCVAQADCILLVAAEGAQPGMGECEGRLVFGSGLPSAVQSFSPPSSAAAGVHRTSAGVAASSSSASLAGGSGHLQPPPPPTSGSGSSIHMAASSPLAPHRAGGAARPSSHLSHAAEAPSMSELLHGTPRQQAQAGLQGTDNGRFSAAGTAAAAAAPKVSGSGAAPASGSPPHVQGYAHTLLHSGSMGRGGGGGSMSPLVAAANAAAAADAASASASSANLSSSGQVPTVSAAAAAAAAGAGSQRAPLSRDTSFAAPPANAGWASAGMRGGGTGSATSSAASASAAALAALGLVPGSSGGAGLAALRRVELVLLHPPSGELPSGTCGWLATRPHLTRHHHVRLAHEADVARLARWMAGRAVGLVLSGGGSRGLAHLGVLCALEDAGVAVDVVGGTSQGAFMSGLYAQGLGREALQVAVQYYARRMGSMRHLLADLTLPLLSLFSGAAFDDALRATFAAGASEIEDLWLPFFCVSTNLTRGEPSIHTRGCLWRLVRASMTIVGLLPPMFENGDLLVDGGYMNNLPVDVMRSLGVDTVIVVDVEGKDDTGWRNLTPYDGGVSGWRLLWDRWCPVPSWRYGVRLPRYSQIINQLTWMTHAHNLRRVSEDYRIDLYLRPPNIGSYKLMDFHLMERIVKDAYRYASLTVSKWPLLSRVVAPGGARGPAHSGAAAAAAAAAAQQPVSGVAMQYPPQRAHAQAYQQANQPQTQQAHQPPPPSPLYVPASPLVPPIRIGGMGGGPGGMGMGGAAPAWASGMAGAASSSTAAGVRQGGSGATAATTPPTTTAAVGGLGGRGGPTTGLQPGSSTAGTSGSTVVGSAGRGPGSPPPTVGTAVHPTSSILCMSQLQKKVGGAEHGGGAAAGNSTSAPVGARRVGGLSGLAGMATGGQPGAPLQLVTASSATAPPPSASAIAAGLLARTSLTGGSGHAGGDGGRHHATTARTQPPAHAHFAQPQQQAVQQPMHPVHGVMNANNAVQQQQQQDVRGPSNGVDPSQHESQTPSSAGGADGGWAQQQQDGERSSLGGSGGMADSSGSTPEARPRARMTKVKTHQSLLDLAAMAGGDSD